MASGTISGPGPDSYGSMLELSWNGEKPIRLNSGINRTFVEDKDTVCMRAYAEKKGARLGFGEVSNKILPAI
jgi:fumarylacetoacetase